MTRHFGTRPIHAILGGILVLFSLAVFGQVQAQQAFERGWTLQPEASALNFQSVKNLTKVESSSFAVFDGTIAPDGAVNVTVQLESVDTKIDLRNVRMRFLFFETFQFPTATITAKLDPAMLADLAKTRRKRMELPVTLELHGVSKELMAELSVTLLNDDLVAVSSSTPISVATADFNLDGGIKKLEEAANVAIVPSASVTFDFLFLRNAEGAAPALVAAAEPVQPTPVALETQGNFTQEQCVGRFEILSRTDNIQFRAGSAALAGSSAPLLNSIVDIASRCPDLKIEVGGHTDADGGAASNLRLSERRAGSVTEYLRTNGVPAERIVAVGYGEARPVVPNTTPDNKRRNRRIEFTVLDD